MSPTFRLIRIPTLVVLACLLLAALTVVEGNATASAAKPCSFSKPIDAYPGKGAQTSELRATNISCVYARTFTRAYYRCRTHSGKTLDGRCTKVNNFSCKEGKRNYGEELNGKPTQFAVRVTCTRAKQRIVHAFLQYINGGS